LRRTGTRWPPGIEFPGGADTKLPRTIIYVDEMVRNPSGKADYRWAKKTALESLGVRE